MIKVRCASCGKTLQLPDQFAGKRGKCPGCQVMLTVPAAPTAAPAPAPAPAKVRKPAPPPVEEVEEVEEVEPEAVEEAEPEEVEEVEAITAKPAKKRPRPVADDDEEEVEDRVAKRPAKKRPPVEDEEEDEDRPRKKKKKSKRPRGEWADCPSCGAADATRVHWTIWGGLIGPAFINTVRCNDCGTNYNGVHGDYNTTRIIIFMVVNFALAAIITALALFLKAST